jgi:Zinc finger, C2H2 type
MPATYNCTGCNVVFDTKAERNNHFRNVCQALVSVTEANGTIHRIERIDGKFTCVRCPKAFARSDKLNAHWKVCMTKDGTESN